MQKSLACLAKKVNNFIICTNYILLLDSWAWITCALVSTHVVADDDDFHICLTSPDYSRFEFSNSNIYKSFAIQSLKIWSHHKFLYFDACNIVWRITFYTFHYVNINKHKHSTIYISRLMWTDNTTMAEFTSPITCCMLMNSYKNTNAEKKHGSG